MDSYKAAAYNVRIAVREAKKRPWEESGATIPGGQFSDSLSSADESPASELNNFSARFEAIGSQQAKTSEAEVNGWVGEEGSQQEQTVSVGGSSNYVLTN